MTRAGDTMERRSRGRQGKTCPSEGIEMRAFVLSLLAVLIGLFVGFVLFELAAILLSGQAAEAGIQRILVRLALACTGIALVVAVLRRGIR